MASSPIDVANPARTGAVKAGSSSRADALFREASRNRGSEPLHRFKAMLEQHKQSNEPTDAAQSQSSEKTDKPRDAKPSAKAERKRGGSRVGEADDETDVEGEAAAAEDSTAADAPNVESETASSEDDHAGAEAPEATDAKPKDQQHDADGVDPSLLLQVSAGDTTRNAAANAVTTDAAGQSKSSDSSVAAAGTDVTTQGSTAQATSTAAAGTGKGTEGAAGEQQTQPTDLATDAPKLGEGVKKPEKAEGNSSDVSQIIGDESAEPREAATKGSAHVTAKDQMPADVAQVLPQPAHAKTESLPPTSMPTTPVTAEQRFAEDNHDTIVTSIRGELAKGGSVQLRLDPPSLGKIDVRVTVDAQGVMSASMQTNNEEATRLLSHSLAQLKTSLESAGVSVDRIQVKQAPANESSSQNQQQRDGDRQQQGYQDHSARQEQQRREMLQRMWRKLGMGFDDLDLVA